MELVSFIKTSGNKSIQVYIPLPEKQFSWDDTRLFTEFIANYLVTEKPDLFTIERLKKIEKADCMSILYNMRKEKQLLRLIQCVDMKMH